MSTHEMKKLEAMKSSSRLKYPRMLQIKVTQEVFDWIEAQWRKDPQARSRADYVRDHLELTMNKERAEKSARRAQKKREAEASPDDKTDD